MANDIAPSKPPASAPLTTGVVQTVSGIASLPTRSKLMLGAGAAMLFAVLVVTFISSRQPDWKVLYANLSDRDGGSVIAALAQLNVPHKFTEGGGAIMVPADKVHDARLKLATQGLPKGGAVGFELMENQKFGVTQFQERLNFQRGLEGELARSIMAMPTVESARVHLALPNQTAFLREQQKPSASVLVSLHGGRTLDRTQIAGIVHLVASSVPELNPRAVSVVDQTGTLLSQPPGEAPNGLDASQLQYVRQIEQNLASRVLAILEPLVGAENVRAQITADVDFTQSESTAEIYKPNQGDAAAAIRSQQVSEGQSGAAAMVGGVPGALSNQPPGNATAPINGASQALSAGGVANGNVSGKRDATTNYEVDKTVRVVRNASGVVRRLNAAVVLNHVSTTASNGKVTTSPIPAAQMEQINALVREAVGFSKDRGDSLNVVNAPFNVPAVPPEVAVPLWKQPETMDLARTIAQWLMLPLVALMILLGLVRPALRAARKPALPGQGGTLLTSVQDALSLPTPTGGSALSPVELTPVELAQQARALQLADVRKLAKSDPATVANVVRTWVTHTS
ncbi:MAG: flagellar M-ring protein FliF [Burkholderiales bacterium]|nr:flagellar M-ring protein FliF [Burkholderiales bacterium]